MKNNLKLLVDPVYTVSDVDKCATFWVLKKIADHWLEQGKNRFVYWAVGPDGTYDSKLITDPRWIRVPCYRSHDRYSEIWMPHRQHYDQFNATNGAFGDWDMLLTTRNAGFYWRRFSGNWGRGAAARFMVLMDPFPLLPFKPTFCSGPPGSFNWYMDVLQHMSNYMMFDRIYLDTEYQVKEIAKLARTTYSPDICNRLSKKFSLTYPSYDSNQLDMQYPLSQEAADMFMTNPFHIIHAGRINASKQFPMIYKALFAAFSKMSTEGYDFRMQVATHSGALPPDMEKDSKFMLLERPGRDQFWTVLKHCHALISFSTGEELPFSMMEATHLGVLSILHRVPWSLDMYGPDYPFYADNESQAYAMFRILYDHRAESWEKYTNWYRDWFLPEIVIKRGGSQELFEKESQEHLAQLSEQWKERARNSEILGNLRTGVVPGKTLDLLNLKDVKEVRSKEDLRKTDWWRTSVYFRRPGRWILGYFLRAYHGWETTRSPWVLRRPKRGGVNEDVDRWGWGDRKGCEGGPGTVL